jgi:hypothetical protein
MGEKKWRAKLAKLFGMLGSANAGERENARRAIHVLLAHNKRTWNDLTELLATGKGEEQWRDPDERAAPPAGGSTTDDADAAIPNVFDLVYFTLQDYLYFKHPHDLVAVALWAMHTFVFDRFMITPRLALLSPVRGCGKTTVLDVIERLTLGAQKFDHTSPALHRLIDQQRPTLLLDEVDNLELAKPGSLRAVLNSGHAREGKVVRYDKGTARSFSTFVPAAFGAIGMLPLPLMHRSIVIRMERAPRAVSLKRFDRNDVDQMDDFDIIYRELHQWSSQCELDRDPAIPKKLHNRRADNWRVLLAVADACHRGEQAREAALAMSRQHQDEDAVVELLADVRRVFDARNVDRLTSADIVGELHDLEDAIWSEWRGSRGDQQPHKLSQAELSILLRPFQIKPRSVWPLGSRVGVKGRKGYYRQDFEAAWSSYCFDDVGGTTAQSANIRRLG